MPKMLQRKAPYSFQQQLRNHGNFVGARNCSSISWFVFSTCSVIGLFFILLNSSMFSSDFPPTPNIKTLKNLYARKFDFEPSDNRFVDRSDNPSAKKFDSDTSVDKYAEILDNPSTKMSTHQFSEKSDSDTSVYQFAEMSDYPSGKTSDANTLAEQSAEKSDDCTGKYIYVLDLPREFNTDLLKNCSSTIILWTDIFCDLIKNSGLGLSINVSDDSLFSDSGWFSTDQYTIEIIFHNRMKQYRCLTDNSSEASAIYVPYYAGLDVARYLWNPNVTLRDELSIKFSEYVKERNEWKKMGGRDHFLVFGRVARAFERQSEDGWGNRLFHIPVMANMTSLLFESNPWSKSQIAIPYPTFFHPSSDIEVHSWQEKVRKKKRPYLFSFAGAPRPGKEGSLRNELIKQCLAAKGRHCKYMDCDATDCRIPQTVMKLFQSSDFCLQPPGDTPTRKSFFDAIIAGCIPIVLHPASAYVQYLWHLPIEYSSYSVFMPMDEVRNGSLSIEKMLLEIPKEKVKAMREEVIKLIPKIVYGNHNTNLDGLDDAFEVTVKGVLDRVAMIRKGMEEGKNSESEDVPGYLAWKYSFFGDLEHNEWDKFFNGSVNIY